MPVVQQQTGKKKSAKLTNKNKNSGVEGLETTETVIGGASIRFAKEGGDASQNASHKSAKTARGASVSAGEGGEAKKAGVFQTPENTFYIEHILYRVFQTLVLLDRDSNLRYSVTSFDEPFTIGRSSRCNMVLDHKIHPSVSRSHAKVYYDPSSGKWDIQDSSSSGTVVNDDGFQAEVFKGSKQRCSRSCRSGT
jgi:hypothetical protein